MPQFTTGHAMLRRPTTIKHEPISASDHFVSVSEMRVEDRLRARLHQLADRFGVATRAGIELRLELTHAQWASLVGASREAVTTAFSKLRGSGSVQMDGRTITIPWEVVRAREEALSLAAAQDF